MFVILDADNNPVQMIAQTSGVFDPPIYFHFMAKLCTKQRKHQPTLLMTEDAWDVLSNPDVTHEGAFGSDYCVISKQKMKERFIDATFDPRDVRWVVVWKFPGDLNHLPGNSFRKIIDVPLPVGEYPLYDDGWSKTQTQHHPSFPKNALVEKMRTDVPSGNSIHYLEDRNGVKVAMIGSHYFIREFWKVTSKEKKGVVDMIKTLRSSLGIECFPCYGQHHAIVLYVDLRDKSLITPRALSTLLQTTPLLNILKQYSYMNMDAWATNVIRLTPKITFASSVPDSSPKSGKQKKHHQPHPTGSLLRKRPVVDSSFVSQTPVPNNAIVNVLAKEDDFVLIQYNTLQGWVRSKYIS